MLAKYIGKKELFKAFVWFFGSVGLVFVISQQVRFLISETDSIPQHYFVQILKIKPKINDYTVVWSDWYHGKIIKKIIGVEGDRIWHDENNQMFVNDFKIGVPPKQTWKKLPEALA